MGLFEYLFMFWLDIHLYAKQYSNLKQSAKGDEIIISDILRRSGNFSLSLYICVRKLCLISRKKSQFAYFFTHLNIFWNSRHFLNIAKLQRSTRIILLICLSSCKKGEDLFSYLKREYEYILHTYTYFKIFLGQGQIDKKIVVLFNWILLPYLLFPIFWPYNPFNFIEMYCIYTCWKYLWRSIVYFIHSINLHFKNANVRLSETN